MATKGFSKINNSIILDSDLSLEAIGLYAKLQYLSTIDNFSIKRNYVKIISGYGETAFRRVWKELKDKGILIETKARSKGRYEYTYTLKNDNAAKVTAPVEEKKSKHIDSNGDTPLDGQVNIYDVIKDDIPDEKVDPVKEEIKKVPDASTDKNIEVISNTTGFNKKESKELLKLAKNNVTKVIEGYQYVKTQKNVKNTFKYTKWVIENQITIRQPNIVSGNKKKSLFNNFEQRNYDFKELEMQLLYGTKSKSLYL